MATIGQYVRFAIPRLWSARKPSTYWMRLGAPKPSRRSSPWWPIRATMFAWQLKRRLTICETYSDLRTWRPGASRGALYPACSGYETLAAAAVAEDRRFEKMKSRDEHGPRALRGS